MDNVNFHDMDDSNYKRIFVKPQDANILKCEHADEYLKAGLSVYCGDKAQWLPEYNAIAEWLADNHGKGILVIGDAGRGKTLLCKRIIPQIINHESVNSGGRVDKCGVMSAYELGRKGEECFHRGFLMIDDIGVETDYYEYGARRNTLCEIIDKAEEFGWVLIMTSNLTIAQMEERYGRRTIDRLRAIVRVVTVSGKSLRNNKASQQ